MLTHLSIRNVVLIRQLDLALDAGLTVLTGETGAGKSILLDSLGLALGHRSDAALLRTGTDQASATAAFDIAASHPARLLAEENGIETHGEDLMLRRTLRPDGRTRAFINDQAVSVTLLKKIGEMLVEVHGQFETQKLLEPSAHGQLLDAFAGNADVSAKVADAFAKWRAAKDALAAAEEAARMSVENEEFLRHAVAELQKLAPEDGEDERLSETRKMLQHGEQVREALSQAQSLLSGNRGVEAQVGQLISVLEKAKDNAAGRLDDTLAALGRAYDETADASSFLNKAVIEFDVDPGALEAAEERLFSLRAVARKHNVPVDDLAGLQERLSAELDDLESGGANLERLAKQTKEARAAYIVAAEQLRATRCAAAEKLRDAMAEELAPLKLGGAEFSVLLEEDAEERWGANGMDRMAFVVSTNPGSPPGPLNKIASGGELARFMLALKVVLAEADPVPVLVFDEVDAGIGGAVASAVGDRLSRLGEIAQILVVTHSPQVAATGAHHLTVSKQDNGADIETGVHLLSADQRREEVARMLSGEQVTGEARAAAESLLRGAA